MGQFEYVVTNAEGRRYVGTLVAVDMEAAMRSLVDKNLVVARIHPVATGSLWQHLRDALGLPSRSPWSTEEIIGFTQQLCAMIESGVTVKQALDVMMEDAEEGPARRLLVDLSTRVSAGQSVTEALSAHPTVFSRQYLATVSAGETGGNLASALAELAGLLEKAEAMRRKVTGALYYPAFITVVSAAFLVLMLVVVVPRYAAFYDTLGGELPPFTQALLGSGRFVSSQLPWLVIAGVVLFLVWGRFSRSERGRLAIDSAKLRLPGVGSLFRLLAIARFCRTMSSLLGCGVPLMQASALVADTMGNAALERAVERVPVQLMEGRGIVETLRTTGIFTRMALSMIGVGEQSGRLDHMLERIATYYEERVDHAVKALTSLVEPLVIIVVGAVVAVMVVALVMPVFNLVNLFMK